MLQKIIIVFTSLFLIVGCATKQENPIKGAWFPDDDWYIAASKDRDGATLKTASGSMIFFKSSHAKNLIQIKEKLSAISGINPGIALVVTDQPNAFAFSRDGKNYVAFSLSFMDALGNNPNAVATIMGHEMAHLKLGHSGKERESREKTSQAIGQASGLLLSLIGVPMGGTIGSLTASGIGRSYTRDEERDADKLGLDWATKAGFDPCGQVAAMNLFEQTKTTLSGISFLSTHPGESERIELANQFSMKINGKRCPN